LLNTTLTMLHNTALQKNQKYIQQTWTLLGSVTRLLGKRHGIKLDRD